MNFNITISAENAPELPFTHKEVTHLASLSYLCIAAPHARKEGFGFIYIYLHLY